MKGSICVSILSFLCTISVPLVWCHNDYHDDFHEKTQRTCGFRDLNGSEKEQMEKRLKSYKETLGSEKLKQVQQSTIVVDVYFHVFMNASGVGAVSDSQIAKQMKILNDAFRGARSMYSECSESETSFTYDGNTVETPFQFDLKQLIRIQSEEGLNLESPTSKAIQKSQRKGTCADLNIFTGDSKLLGNAFLPSQCPADGTNFENAKATDVVLLHYDALPEGRFTGYNEGDSLIHEIGHFLGLEHTFLGGCNGAGDEVDDTPAENEAAFGCPIGRDTCSSQGVDPIHNFMNYSDDCCMYLFTPGQRDRMILQSGLFRGLIDSEENTIFTPTPPAPTPPIPAPTPPTPEPPRPTPSIPSNPSPSSPNDVNEIDGSDDDYFDDVLVFDDILIVDEVTPIDCKSRGKMRRTFTNSIQKLIRGAKSP